MPVTTSYPGVYIEELPSSVHTVTGAATSNAAFVDFFSRGPMNKAVKVGSFREFESSFGGLDRRSEAGYGLMGFFNNGGSEAFIVRVGNTDADNGKVAAVASFANEIDGPMPAETAKAADEHAKAADAAAAAAKAAKPKLGDAKLAENIGMVADKTFEAAEETAAAGEQAKRAAQELEIKLAEAEALDNQAAVDAATAAQGAADDADKAADAAAKAADAAAKVFVKIDATKPKTLTDAQQAADDATNAASAAAASATAAANAAGKARAFQAQVAAGAAGPQLVINAADPGVWGNNLKIAIDVHPVIPHGASAQQFDVIVGEYTVHRGVEKMVRSEAHRNLTLDTNSSNYAVKAINHDSSLIQIQRHGMAADGAYPKALPSDGGAPQQGLAGGTDGDKAGGEDFKKGMRAGLMSIAPDVFNILCLPAVANYPNPSEAEDVYTDAMKFCKENRAFLLVDPPSAEADISSEASFDKLVGDIEAWSKPYRNAQGFSGAVYFPLLKMPDPLHGFRPRNVAPSGAVAGVYARTDASRGVWKAPAGIEATIMGAEPAVTVHDEQSGKLNPLGINVLRSFPVYGSVVWGGRTLAGADLLDSQWKYLSVRRLADFIEDSLFQSLKWVVFEPNDEATWAQIRLEVGTFMAGLFADGAFVGETPDQGYLVKVDDETTTWLDIEQGRVNIVVGFAPVKPAEFVILEIQQLAGQTGS